LAPTETPMKPLLNVKDPWGSLVYLRRVWVAAVRWRLVGRVALQARLGAAAAAGVAVVRGWTHEWRR
jgi:hypothetical protein